MSGDPKIKEFGHVEPQPSNKKQKIKGWAEKPAYETPAAEYETKVIKPEVTTDTESPKTIWNRDDRKTN